MRRPILSILLLAVFATGDSSLAQEKEGPILSPKITTGLRRTFSANEISELESQLQATDKKIAVTASELKRVRDTEFLPDLYFSQADLFLQKSRLMYLIKVNKNKGVPLTELDFTAEKRPKQEAIDIYQKIYAFFPKSRLRDRALFFKALELRDIGQSEAMIKTFGQLNQEFPSSQYLLEANIIMGDYFLEEKKDLEGALEAFRRVVAKELSPYTPLAHYRIGWVFINQQKYREAVNAFEEAVRTQGLVSANITTELPELYRKTDIRREAILSMAVPYVEIYGDYRASLKEDSQERDKIQSATPSTVAPKALPEKVSGWVRPGSNASSIIATKPPPSKAQQMMPFVQHPVEYFKKMSDGHQTYRRVLSRVGRRLALKEMWKEVSEVWIEVLVASSDPEIKFEAIQRWNEAIKKTAQPTDQIRFIEHAVLTAQEVRARAVDRGGKYNRKEANQLKFLELVTRDIATRIQQTARTRNSREDFLKAAQAYEIYQVGFPQNNGLAKMLINKSESLFRAEEWTKAGLEFENLARIMKTKSRQYEFQESAIQAYVNALKEPEKLSPLDLVRARRGVRDVGTAWVVKNMRHPAAASASYNIGQSWYEDRLLPQAIQSFTFFIKNFSRDSRVRDAIFLIINAYSQLDDFKGLIAASKQLEKTPGLSQDDRQAIRDLSKRAQLKDLQLAAGSFGSKEYAENLKSLASKYSDSSMGSAALYEAFTSLRSKRDPELFDVGEALLEKHSDSTFTKEVVSSMAQIAMLTADFERAARYLSRFSDKYPSEKESKDWKKNAAQIYEWMGDFKEAKRLYFALGDLDAVARCEFLGGEWALLEKSSGRMKSDLGDYWSALSLWRQGRQAEALPKLKQIASSGDLDRSSHARFLISQRVLEGFRAIRMRDGADQAALLNKVKSFQALSAELNSIVKLGAGRWTIAALYLLGQANFELGKFIAESPLPNGLKANEQSIYRRELNKQAKQYVDGANAVFAQCMETAERFEVFTRYVQGCQEKGRKVIKEESDILQVGNQKRFTPPKVARSLRTKLYDSPRDVGILTELAHAYIQDGQYWIAMTIFNRILEIEEKNSGAMAGLGVSRMFVNDLDAAADWLKKSLKENESDSVAVWNLSGLYNEFGFRKRFKQLESKRRSAPKPKILHPMARKL